MVFICSLFSCCCKRKAETAITHQLGSTSESDKLQGKITAVGREALLPAEASSAAIIVSTQSVPSSEKTPLLRKLSLTSPQSPYTQALQRGMSSSSITTPFLRSESSVVREKATSEWTVYELRGELESIKEENGHLQNQLSAFEIELLEYQKQSQLQLEKLEKEVIVLKREKEQVEKEKHGLQAQLKMRSPSVIGQTLSSADELEKIIFQKDEQIARLHQQVLELKAKIAESVELDLDSGIVVKKVSNNKKKDQEIAELRQQLARQQEHFQVVNVKLQRELDHIKALHKEQSKLDKREELLIEQEGAKEEREKILTDLVKEKENLEAFVEKERIKIKQLMQTKKSQLEIIDSNKEEIVALEQQLQEKEEEITRLTTELRMAAQLAVSVLTSPSTAGITEDFSEVVISQELEIPISRGEDLP